MAITPTLVGSGMEQDAAGGTNSIITVVSQSATFAVDDLILIGWGVVENSGGGITISSVTTSGGAIGTVTYVDSGNTVAVGGYVTRSVVAYAKVTTGFTGTVTVTRTGSGTPDHWEIAGFYRVSGQDLTTPIAQSATSKGEAGTGTTLTCTFGAAPTSTSLIFGTFMNNFTPGTITPPSGYTSIQKMETTWGSGGDVSYKNGSGGTTVQWSTSSNNSGMTAAVVEVAQAAAGASPTPAIVISSIGVAARPAPSYLRRVLTPGSTFPGWDQQSKRLPVAVTPPAHTPAAPSAKRNVLTPGSTFPGWDRQARVPYGRGTPASAVPSGALRLNLDPSTFPIVGGPPTMAWTIAAAPTAVAQPIGGGGLRLSLLPGSTFPGWDQQARVLYGRGTSAAVPTPGALELNLDPSTFPVAVVVTKAYQGLVLPPAAQPLGTGAAAAAAVRPQGIFIALPETLYAAPNLQPLSTGNAQPVGLGPMIVYRRAYGRNVMPAYVPFVDRRSWVRVVLLANGNNPIVLILAPGWALSTVRPLAAADTTIRLLAAGTSTLRSLGG